MGRPKMGVLVTYFHGLHLNSEFISKGGTKNKKLCLYSSVKIFTLIAKVPEPWGNIYSEHKVTHSLLSVIQVVQKFHSKANASTYFNLCFLVY